MGGGLRAITGCLSRSAVGGRVSIDLRGLPPHKARNPDQPTHAAVYLSKSTRCGGFGGECPERQRGRTVNPLAYAFVGSSPTSPTTLKYLYKTSNGSEQNRPILCRMCCRIFPSDFNGCQALPAGPCDMRATCVRSVLPSELGSDTETRSALPIAEKARHPRLVALATRSCLLLRPPLPLDPRCVDAAKQKARHRTAGASVLLIRLMHRIWSRAAQSF